MFTGLIEEIGRTAAIVRRPGAIQLSIRADRILKNVGIGDSIAVNGACVTVVTVSSHRFAVDVMPETIRSTTLKLLRMNDPVNLERAMQSNDRYGGHFVTGHVDGIGRIARMSVRGNAHMLDIRTAPEWLAQMAVKGSVAIDGTSLTLFGVETDHFTVSLIAYSQAHSILGEKRVGDYVNIECDILGKYVRKHLEKHPETEKAEGILTFKTLRENGFA